MAKLESYSNLSKLQEDLIKKGFCFGQLFALGVYSKTPQGINLKSSFKHSTNKDNSFNNSASTYFNYKNKGFSFKEDLQTSKIFKVTIEYVPESYNKVKGKVEVELDSQANTQKKTASAEYTHDKFKAKFAVTDDIAIKLSAVGSLASQGGAGVDLAFDVGSTRLVGYNAALWWFADDYRFVLKHTSTNKKQYQFGSVTGSVLYNLCPKAKVAGAVVYEKSKPIKANFGIEYDAGESRTFKSRFDQDFTLGFSMRSKVNQYITLVTASQFNIFEAGTPHMQFGVRLKVNQ